MTTTTTLRAALVAALLSATAASAQPLDAGVLDAGLVDAGFIDAGFVDAGFVDAGFVDAGFVDAGVVIDAGVVVDAPIEPADVVARDAVSPLRFVRAEGKASARARAAAASRALVAALETRGPPELAGVTVRVEDDVVVARVDGVIVATFTAADVLADGGLGLEAFASAREAQLEAFVEGQRQRDELRHTVTQFTFSVAIALLAFLLLRAQRRLFAGWQESLEQRGPLTSPNVMGVPLLSPDASRALLGSGLHILKFLAITGTIFAAVVTIGGQFARTRPWVELLIDGLVGPVVRGANAALRGVPGVLLAGVIALVSLAVYRFVRILLDGVAAGRVRSALFQKEQAPVARVLVGGVVVVVAALLVVSAFFLRFGTSFETLVLIGASAVALGAVPFFANGVAGLAVQWRQPFGPGDHIRVGAAHGEVVRVRFHDVLLVPEEGGTITVPMLSVLLQPLQRLPSEPRAHVDTIVARDRGSDVVLDSLNKLVKVVDDRGSVEVLAASSSTLTVRLIAGRGDGAQQNLWRALLRACDSGEVRLADREGSGAVRLADGSGAIVRAEERG